jgi:glycosyltransferase involved in cell wall biosynthesis
MEKIKVCHVVNIISGKSDGVYAHLKMLFKYLDANRFEQYLVFQGDPAIEEEVKSLGVTVYPMPSLKKKFSLAVFVELYRFLKKNEISIIHTHLIKPYVIVGVVNVFLKEKAIFNYHGSFIKNDEYHTTLEEVVYKLAHLVVHLCRSYQRVVVPSQSSQRILLAETHLLPPIEVYYNGGTLDKKTPADDREPNIIQNLVPNKHRIGIVSRFEPEKRIDVALHIAQQLLSRRNDVHFFILGDGVLEDRMRRLASELQLTGRVTILGFLPNVQEYLSAFDIVLITSDREGLPFIVWEAMAKGVPIVASDVGGIREIVEREQCGKVYERRNVQEAVSLLDQLLSDDAMREAMGRSGRSAIEKKYNALQFGRKFESIYLSVMNT